MILQSVERALELVAVLARSPKPLSVMEISRQLNINRTTAYGLVNTLLLHNYIEKDEETGKLTLGHKLLELGANYRYKLSFMSKTEKEALVLTEKWGLSVHAGVYPGDGSVLFVLIHLPQNVVGLQPTPPLGFKTKAYATGMGKILLAHLPDDELTDQLNRTELKAFTPHTLINRVKLADELTEIKTKGFALDREEHVEGVACVAAPIRDYTGRVIAAISLSGAASRIYKMKRELVEDIVASGQKISKALGWQKNGTTW